MFNIKNLDDGALFELIENLNIAIENGIGGDPRVDSIMKEKVGPFMIESVQEILLLRLKLRNAEEIKAMQKNLLDQYEWQLDSVIRSIR